MKMSFKKEGGGVLQIIGFNFIFKISYRRFYIKLSAYSLYANILRNYNALMLLSLHNFQPKNIRIGLLWYMTLTASFNKTRKIRHLLD